MSDVTSVLFVGVGGQGTILASKILTIGLIEHGYDVKMSEVHGMIFIETGFNGLSYVCGASAGLL